MKAARGFTIVELMTVVVTFAILVTLVTLSYNLTEKQSRDNGRRVDVILLKGALEKYYDDNGFYPYVCPVAGNSCDAAAYLTTLLVPKYLKLMPTPPKAGETYQYVSVYAPPNTTSYAILVANESISRCKTGTRVIASWWGGDTTTPRCNY